MPEVGRKLRRFAPDEIMIDADEARVIYRNFFEGIPNIIQAVEAKEFQHLHLEFAQALLVEALDRTYDMGFVHALAASIFDKKRVISQAQTILFKFGKTAAQHWFRHATADDLWDDPKIYESVRIMLVASFRTEAFIILTQDQSVGY